MGEKLSRLEGIRAARRVAAFDRRPRAALRPRLKTRRERRRARDRRHPRICGAISPTGKKQGERRSASFVGLANFCASLRPRRRARRYSDSADRLLFEIAPVFVSRKRISIRNRNGNRRISSVIIMYRVIMCLNQHPIPIRYTYYELRE